MLEWSGSGEDRLLSCRRPTGGHVPTQWEGGGHLSGVFSLDAEPRGDSTFQQEVNPDAHDRKEEGKDHLKEPRTFLNKLHSYVCWFLGALPGF